MPEPLERTLTPAQVAALLSVSTETVNRWADEGKLVGFRTPGGRWRFPESSLRALFAGDVS